MSYCTESGSYWSESDSFFSKEDFSGSFYSEEDPSDILSVNPLLSVL